MFCATCTDPEAPATTCPLCTLCPIILVKGSKMLYFNVLCNSVLSQRHLVSQLGATLSKMRPKKTFFVGPAEGNLVQLSEDGESVSPKTSQNLVKASLATEAEILRLYRNAICLGASEGGSLQTNLQ